MVTIYSTFTAGKSTALARIRYSVREEYPFAAGKSAALARISRSLREQGPFPLIRKPQQQLNGIQPHSVSEANAKDNAQQLNGKSQNHNAACESGLACKRRCFVPRRGPIAGAVGG